jgi:diguanylate cyclase
MSYLSVLAYMYYLFLGILILFQNRKSNVNRIAFILCITQFLLALFMSFGFSTDNAESLRFWLRITIISGCWFCSFNIHLYYEILFKKKKNIFILLLIHLPAIVFTIQNITGPQVLAMEKQPDGWLFYPNTGTPWLPVYIIILFIYMIFNIIILLYWYKTSDTQKGKRQAQTILIFYCASMLIGWLDAWFLPLLVSYKSIGLTPVLFSVYFTGIYIAIFKYRFLSLTPELISNELVENIDEAVILFDCNLNLIFLNKKAKELSEKSGKEKEYFTEYFDKNVHIKNRIIQMIKGGNDTITLKHIITGEDSKKKLMDAYFSVVRDRFKDKLGVIMIGRELKGLETFINKYSITERELEIIEKIISGEKNKDIAKSLDITERTVKMHTGNIYQKLNVENRIQMINVINEYEFF